MVNSVWITFTKINCIMFWFYRNETSLVSLKVLEKGKKLQEVVYGHSYTLRADISRPDGKLRYIISYLMNYLFCCYLTYSSYWLIELFVSYSIVLTFTYFLFTTPSSCYPVNDVLYTILVRFLKKN